MSSRRTGPTTACSSLRRPRHPDREPGHGRRSGLRARPHPPHQHLIPPGGACRDAPGSGGTDESGVAQDGRDPRPGQRAGGGAVRRVLGAPASLLAGIVGSRRAMSQIMQTALVGVGVLMIVVALGELGLMRRLLPGLRLGLTSAEQVLPRPARGLIARRPWWASAWRRASASVCTQPLYLALRGVRRRCGQRALRRPRPRCLRPGTGDIGRARRPHPAARRTGGTLQYLAGVPRGVRSTWCRGWSSPYSGRSRCHSSGCATPSRRVDDAYVDFGDADRTHSQERDTFRTNGKIVTSRSDGVTLGCRSGRWWGCYERHRIVGGARHDEHVEAPAHLRGGRRRRRHLGVHLESRVLELGGECASWDLRRPERADREPRNGDVFWLRAWPGPYRVTLLRAGGARRAAADANGQQTIDSG